MVVNLNGSTIIFHSLRLWENEFPARSTRNNPHKPLILLRNKNYEELRNRRLRKFLVRTDRYARNNLQMKFFFAMIVQQENYLNSNICNSFCRESTICPRNTVSNFALQKTNKSRDNDVNNFFLFALQCTIV